MVKQVTSCKDCIFKTNDKDDSPYCKIDSELRDLITDNTGYYVTDEVPEWCPVKKEEITIRFKN